MIRKSFTSSQRQKMPLLRRVLHRDNSCDRVVLPSLISKFSDPPAHNEYVRCFDQFTDRCESIPGRNIMLLSKLPTRSSGSQPGYFPSVPLVVMVICQSQTPTKNMEPGPRSSNRQPQRPSGVQIGGL